MAWAESNPRSAGVIFKCSHNDRKHFSPSFPSDSHLLANDITSSTSERHHRLPVWHPRKTAPVHGTKSGQTQGWRKMFCVNSVTRPDEWEITNHILKYFVEPCTSHQWVTKFIKIHHLIQFRIWTNLLVYRNPFLITELSYFKMHLLQTHANNCTHTACIISKEKQWQ